MKKTNVFLEVDDKVYNTVVEPHKRAKTFSRLIAALLKGYIEDEYVRAYGDDMVDDLRKASVDSLDTALDEMQESLANIGLFTDELQMVNNNGNSFFSKKTEDYKENVEKTEKYFKQDVVESPKSNEKTEKDVETEKLREEMDLMRRQMTEMYEQNLEIMKMLQNTAKEVVNSGGVQVEGNIQSEVQETLKGMQEASVTEKGRSVLESEDDLSVSKELDEKFTTAVFDDEEEDEVEEQTPMFDMGFLSDAAMSF